MHSPTAILLPAAIARARSAAVLLVVIVRLHLHARVRLSLPAASAASSARAHRRIGREELLALVALSAAAAAEDAKAGREAREQGEQRQDDRDPALGEALQVGFGAAIAALIAGTTTILITSLMHLQDGHHIRAACEVDLNLAEQRLVRHDKLVDGGAGREAAAEVEHAALELERVGDGLIRRLQLRLRRAATGRRVAPALRAQVRVARVGDGEQSSAISPPGLKAPGNIAS